MNDRSIESLTSAALIALCCGLARCSSESAGGRQTEAGGTSGATAVLGGGGTTSSGSSASGGSGADPVGGLGGLAALGGSGGLGARGGDAGIAGFSGTAGGGTTADASCGQDAILCEDFEKYPRDSAPAGVWTASQRGSGKIVVDSTRAFSGKQSLHVTGKLNADHANISQPIHTESQTAYVRFMFYATSYPASSGVHSRLMRIGTANAATGDPDTSFSFASYNGTAIEKVNSIYLRDTGTKLNDPATLNEWKCWEFAIDRSGGVGKVKVQIWLDGQELKLSTAGSSSHGMTSPSWDPIPFELFMLGLDGFQVDAQPADFWIDDLSVTPQRVGCKRAQ